MREPGRTPGKRSARRLARCDYLAERLAPAVSRGEVGAIREARWLERWRLELQGIHVGSPLVQVQQNVVVQEAEAEDPREEILAALGRFFIFTSSFPREVPLGGVANAGQHGHDGDAQNHDHDC